MLVLLGQTTPDVYSTSLVEYCSNRSQTTRYISIAQRKRPLRGFSSTREE